MMKNAVLFIFALLAFPYSYAAQNYSTTSTQDNAFMQLREASRKENPERAEQFAKKLTDYPIQSYVEYYLLKSRLRNASEPEIRAYLAKYNGSAIADRLRNDWLLVLGENGNWETFDKEYPLFQLKDDLQLKCYALQSRVEKDQNVAEDARALLVTPKKYGKACFSLLTTLAKNGQFSADDLWIQVRLAGENNMPALAQRIAVLAGANQANVAKAWGSSSILTSGPGNDRVSREIFLLALGQNAKKDHAQAANTLKKNTAGLSSKEVAIGWAQIAYPASLALSQDALGYWKKAKNAPLSANLQEWRVRMALRAGNWRQVYDWIQEMPSSLQKDPAWVYWKGRALLVQGHRMEAHKLFETIANQHHFYGQLALEELGHKVTIPKHAVTLKEAEIAPMKSNEGLQVALKFFDMNLRFEGVREWNWQLRGMSERELLAAAEFARQNNVLDRMVNTSDRTREEHDFTQRFPSPYYNRMQTAANELGLDVAWKYGLIRQESRFVTNARSSAGASGLMQLMPDTAKYVAKKIGLKNYQSGGINSVDTNILLGSNYLKIVLNDLGGSQTLATAAYNAGPRRPRAWKATLPHEIEGAVFAETIPFSETRDYVKNVMSNATYYAALFEGKPQSLKERLGSVSP